MAKSKAFKAAKQQQREEDFSATDALDAEFKQLLEAGNLGLQFKPSGSRGDKPAPGSLDPQDVAYDRMRRELIFEAKAQVRACGHAISNLCTGRALTRRS